MQTLGVDFSYSLSLVSVEILFQVLGWHGQMSLKLG